MPLETEPIIKVPKNRIPPNSEPYKVVDGDSWEKIAKRIGVDTWDLIDFNFKTKDPREVNWYLHHYVGCDLPTNDKLNWRFSSSAKPGIIFLPVCISYVVPGIIAPIKQDDTRNCWAAMYTMMYSWRHNMSVSIETAISGLGNPYIDIYKNNKGLSINDISHMALMAHMTAEPLQNWTLKGWADLLKRYGLLWTNYGWQTPKDIGRHAIVLYGLRCDPINGQMVLYVDPSDGQRHEMTFLKAVGQHELGFTLTPLKDSALSQFSQVLHY